MVSLFHLFLDQAGAFLYLKKKNPIGCMSLLSFYLLIKWSAGGMSPQSPSVEVITGHT